MRVDQFQKLQGLSEKLADIAIVDADPATWAAAGLNAGQMTQTQRGDAYWSRKMALSTISVLMRVQGLIHSTQQFGDTPPLGAPPVEPVDDTPSLDAEIAQAERDAVKVLAKAMGGRES